MAGRRDLDSGKMHIKNMVTKTCRVIIGKELDSLAIRYHNIEMGVITLAETPDKGLLQKFSDNISKYGMEIMYDGIAALADRIKTAVIEFVHLNDPIPRVRYSAYLSEKLGYDYSYLSSVFSSVSHTTIQQFIIINKIERAKSLLSEGRCNLSEIAIALDYSSVAHLSSQFKRITGITPTLYKQRQKANDVTRTAAEPALFRANSDAADQN